jgi:hypothetical protein
LALHKLEQVLILSRTKSAPPILVFVVQREHINLVSLIDSIPLRMSMCTRQIASTAKVATKRQSALASIATSAPVSRMRTRSYSPRTVSARPTVRSQSLAPLPRFASTLNDTPVADASSVPVISAENTYDVVIIGAGNAGLALAASLCESII